jgi:hypothetical protein
VKEREAAASERVCRNWFAKFRAAHATREDAERSGRPLMLDDQIETLIEE